MRIFRVTVETETTVYVAAETQEDAEADAESYAQEERFGLDADVHSVEVTDPAVLPDGDLDSIPYGNHEGDRTVRQFLSETDDGEPKPVPDTWTLDLFPKTEPSAA